MYCVFFLKKSGQKIFLDFFKTEKTACRYMDTFKHLKIDGDIIMDFVSRETIEEILK